MIKEIKEIQNHGLIQEIHNSPNQAILWEIINKGKSGKIFELYGGAIIILENCDDPFAFLLGPQTTQSIEEAISIVSSRKFPMIYCCPTYHPIFLEKGWDFNLRVELQIDNPLEKTTIDNDVTIKPIKTIELFKKCFCYKERSELYGSDENFIKYGLGYALYYDDIVLSEAYATIGANCAEIGIITHPDHRGKGYASQIATHLIKKCKELNLTPMWSCQIHNRLSLNTALKLGFKPKRYYVQMVPEVGNVLGPSLANWLKNNHYPMNQDYFPTGNEMPNNKDIGFLTQKINEGNLRTILIYET